MPATIETRVPTVSPVYRRWLLGLLAATYASAFVDRMIISIVGHAIIRDLGLTDVQFGLLGGLAFAIFFSTCGIPIARLAERHSRITIIAAATAVWSLMTIACGLATGYGQLLLFRMGVGIGEAGHVPASHSLISDHVPPERRTTALAIFSLGIPVGAVIGAIGGGWLAQHYGWQTALIAVGAPGLAIALLVGLTLREPPRGRFDAKATTSEAPPFAAVVRELFTNRTFRHVLAGGVLVTFAVNGINLFAPAYFVRRFGLSLAEAGLFFGLMAGTAGTVGILAGGFLADRGARHDPRWRVWSPAIGVLAGAPLIAIGYSRHSVAATLLTILVGGASIALYFAPTFALAQNLAAPRMRASAAAIVVLAVNVIGQGLGPLFIGALSEAFASQAFAGGDYGVLCRGTAPIVECGRAAALGLQRAILATTAFIVWGGIHYVIAARAIAAAPRPASV